MTRPANALVSSAVPDKVEVNRDEAQAVHDLIQGGDWARLSPKAWMLLRDDLKPRLAAALAAFRATEGGS